MLKGLPVPAENLTFFNKIWRIFLQTFNVSTKSTTNMSLNVLTVVFKPDDCAERLTACYGWTALGCPCNAYQCRGRDGLGASGPATGFSTQRASSSSFLCFVVVFGFYLLLESSFFVISSIKWPVCSKFEKKTLLIGIKRNN
jgi:hypothetical protein